MKHSKLISVIILYCAIGALYGQGESEVISLTVGSPGVGTTSRNVTFKGTLLDKDTNEPIAGATIVRESGVGTTTDLNGVFTLGFRSGIHEVRVDYLGYRQIVLQLEMYEDLTVDVLMSPSATLLDQVVINDRSATDQIQSTISGVERLTIEELAQSSQLLGELDVLRSIQTLSGVTSVGDGASGFNVRGGNADENLILQDDALIINPAHTLGFFSLFHPDLINSVELFKGNQPAYYGGRLSSVLQVNLREGDKEKYAAQGGIGMAASRISMEGPIKRGKSSFIIGARASYMDYLLNLANNINVKNSETFFYDLTVKADARVSEKSKVGFTAFMSGDNFQFGEEVNFDYRTRTVTGYWNQLITDKWNLRAIVNIGDYNSSLFDIQGSDQSRFSTAISYIRGAVRSFYQPSDALQVLAGIEYNRYSVLPGALAPEGESSTAVPQSLNREVGVAMTPYLQLEWTPLDALTIQGGLRYTLYDRPGPGQVATYTEGLPRSGSTLIELQDIDGTLASYTGWEPRVAINYRVSKNTALKAGYNRGFQYLNQISNTATATPVDIWKLSDRYVAPQASDNYNFGVFQDFGRDRQYAASIDFFYRDQERIVEYRDFPNLLLNEFLERDLVDGIGRAYGLELNFKKSLGKSTYQLNYTYSRAERRVEASETQQSINQGQWYPSNFDRPHAANLNFTTQTGPKTKLSVNFTFSTGRPLTVPISNFSVDNVANVPIFSNRNQFRIPDYHRLDFAYTIGPFGKGGLNNTLTFSVYNVYARRNAYSVYFRQRSFQRVRAIRIATLGSIFPSITYNFKIK